jgi:hypothetical protein
LKTEALQNASICPYKALHICARWYGKILFGEKTAETEFGMQPFDYSIFCWRLENEIL